MPRPKVDKKRSDQILDALESCIVEKGLSSTTLKEVADMANLPRPLVRYYVGNRNAMILKLLERIIMRGEQQLLELGETREEPTLVSLIDFVFTTVFDNKTSNKIIGELWYLAERDPVIGSKLAELYGRICNLLVQAMARDGLGKNNNERHDLAIALVSLSYGYASFKQHGLVPRKKSSWKVVAHKIIGTLPEKTEHGTTLISQNSFH